jgi:hypothetical protein
MNSDFFRPALALLLAASLFLIGCKDNKPAEPPKPEAASEQVEEVETEIVEEEPTAEDITEPPPVVREAQLYTPRPFPNLRVIYNQ